MSTQELRCFENGLAYMSMYKLSEYPEKIKVYLNGIFATVFKNPWDNWDKIRRVFGTFGAYKSQENGSFSKYEDQGDSQKGPYQLNYQNTGVLIQMYEIAKKLDILIDAEDVAITYKYPPTPKETENFSKWSSLASQFEKIIDINTTFMVSVFAMAPLLYQDTLNPLGLDSYWERSPAQMKLYNSYLMKTAITLSEKYGGLSSESCIHRVPYNTIDAIFPTMVSGITGDWWYNLIAQQIVNTQHEMVNAPLYTITADDVTKGYFEFDRLTDNVVHMEYLIILPDDSTADISVELKTCYGDTFGLSLLYPCDLCDYAGDCKTARYINPSNIDHFINNRIHITGITPSLIAGDRIRIKYKKVTVV